MRPEPDAAKLDELKRLLQRLDKALPQAAAGEAQALSVRSRSVRAGAAAQRSDTTVLRTVLLAGGVSMVISLSVALLLFHDTPVRRFIAAQVPPKDDGGQAPAQGNGSSTGNQPPRFITETAMPRLQTEQPAARKDTGEVAPGHGPLPDAASTATLEERSEPPSSMETGGVGGAASRAAAALDTTEQPVGPPHASGSTPLPAEKPDTDMQPHASRSALVELDAEQFMRRGLLMLSRGSVSAAQLLLERAADLGSGDAAFVLASTYDGAPGAPRQGSEVRPNVDLAARWYAHAQKLGSEEASKRLAELRKGDDASSQ